MCGIWGFNRKGISATCQGAKVRGLDGSKERSNREITFGHSLLSISSRSIYSSQQEPKLPFKSFESLFTYNGEIFAFGSNIPQADDTSHLIKSIESIDPHDLHEKLGEILNSFNGFFAFAFYSKITSTVILARDRYGQKPLYYSTKDKNFYFSSSAIDCLEWFSPGYQYSSPFVHENRGGGVYIDEQNPFPGVFQVPAGHFVSINLKGSRLNLTDTKWYFPVKRLDAFKPVSLKYFEETTRELHDLLIDSIKLRSTSDSVLSLSGGVDSTLLAAIHSKKISPLPAYSLDVADHQFNELETVKAVAHYLRIPLHIVQNNVSIKDFVMGVHLLEASSFNCSFAGFIEFYRAIAANSRVCIEGHGADELFGGYPNFIRQLIIDKGIRGNYKELPHLLSSFTKTSSLGKAKTFISLLKGLFLHLKSNDNTEKLLDSFFWRTSLPMVLRTFDRIQMQSGIEGRSPFLDYRVVEFIQKQPLDYLFYEGEIKAPLKYLLDKEYNILRLLPTKKIGFTSSYKTVYQLTNQLSLSNFNEQSRRINQVEIFNAVMAKHARGDCLKM